VIPDKFPEYNVSKRIVDTVRKTASNLSFALPKNLKNGRPVADLVVVAIIVRDRPSDRLLKWVKRAGIWKYEQREEATEKEKEKKRVYAIRLEPDMYRSLLVNVTIAGLQH
jgi:hypothetical protein